MLSKFILSAFACGAVACASLPYYPPVYITKTARSVLTSKADSLIVHVDEKLMIQLDAVLLLGRKEQLEQGGCLHIAGRRGTELWVDSLLSASITPGMTTRVQITMACDGDQVPIHWHVTMNDPEYDQCQPSDLDFAASRDYAAEMLQCGSGIDSLIAWRAKP